MADFMANFHDPYIDDFQIVFGSKQIKYYLLYYLNALALHNLDYKTFFKHKYDQHKLEPNNHD